MRASSGSRLFTTAVVFGAAAVATVFACSGGGGGKSPDAKVYMDAPKVFMDAPTSSAKGIGDKCTPPGSGSGQGDCPNGYICLSLQGGNGAWCSKPCTQGTGDTCNQGYTGVGVAACVFGITFTMGGTPVDMCGVICQDSTGSCPANVCNNTCPSPLMCAAQLKNGSGSNVAKACD
jgi:hypothetical protein